MCESGCQGHPRPHTTPGGPTDAGTGPWLGVFTSEFHGGDNPEPPYERWEKEPLNLKLVVIERLPNGHVVPLDP